MEAATRLIERRSNSAPATPVSVSELTPSLTVTASYLLSEEGRKALLLSGGDGRAVQHVTLKIPANRLHLVSVDPEGVARLKLRPRFETDENMHIVRLDSTPVYDAPPSPDDLCRAAARYHELSIAYRAECGLARARRRDEEREFRERAVHEFLLDKSRRALASPAPSPSRCYLMIDNRRLLFDLSEDEGLAREVPGEAYSRFCDDEARKDRRHRGDVPPRACDARPQRTAVRPPVSWVRRGQLAGPRHALRARQSLPFGRTATAGGGELSERRTGQRAGSDRMPPGLRIV